TSQFRAEPAHRLCSRFNHRQNRRPSSAWLPGRRACGSHLLPDYLPGEPHCQLSRQSRGERHDRDDWKSRDFVPAALSVEHGRGTREPVRNMGSDREAPSVSEAGRVSSLMQTHLASSKQRSDLADDVLVQRAQSGDHGAFELLVDRYSALLLRLICHLVQDEHLAQDVLQHVFLQLYRSLPTLRVGGTLKAWLSQVARHRCFDELRRKRPVFFSEIAPEPEGSEFSPLLLLSDPDLLPEE